MKSQSNEYPTVTQYDSDHIAVPINIIETIKDNPLEAKQIVWECDILIVPFVPAGLNSQAVYIKTVQAVLDAKVQEREYYGILSACTYVTSNDVTFRAEGQACVAWRDAVWKKCYEILAMMQEGRIPIPTINELLQELPGLIWPNI